MYAGHDHNVMGSGVSRWGKEPFERCQTDMHSIHRQRRLKENEEGRTFPVCRAYRQPDAISEGVATGETLEVG